MPLSELARRCASVWVNRRKDFRMVLVAAALSACAGPEGGLDLTLGVSPTPATVGEARIIVSIRDPTGAPVDDAVVALTGELPDSPGAVPESPAHHERDGRYIVEAFPFPTAGEWTVVVTVTRSDGTITRTPRRVSVVGWSR